MNGFLQDVNYALRQLARNRVFSIVAISTLALGIGLTAIAYVRKGQQLALNEGLRLCLVAIAIGAGMAFPAMHIITGLLGLGPIDFVSFLGVSFLLGGVAMLAAYLPARRAPNVDPMVALRYG